MDQIVNATSTVLNAAASTTAWAIKPIIKQLGSIASYQQEPPKIVSQTIVNQLPPNVRKWIGLAGLFGASAVAIGAYGAHVVYPKPKEIVSDSRKAIFETANKYHFIHSLALIGVPFCRYPKATGMLYVVGMLVFSGTCYYHALTNNVEITQFTPYGGMALIFAWLSLAIP